MIYLDYNATAPLLPSVKKSMIEAMDVIGNASSVHKAGRATRQLIEESRLKVAQKLNVAPARVIFTSGATEANNMALKGFKGPLIVSGIEHDSVYEARPDAHVCEVTAAGIVDLNHLELLLQKVSSPLVSIMAANNETGAIQPLSQIAEMIRHYNGYFHCDAVQAIGKINIDWTNLKCDMISLSAHKLGGPQGVGALIVSTSLALMPCFKGGGQERYFRPGTENLLGIIGFGQAILEDHDWKPTQNLRDYIQERILEICPESDVFSKQINRLPNTLNFTMPGVRSDTQVMSFDLADIAVSAGSACSSGKVKPSRVLQAIRIKQKNIENALRISLGPNTTKDEADRFIEVWQQIYQQVKR